MTPTLEAAAAVTSAYGVVVRTLVHIIGELNTQITALEAELTTAFEQHVDAEIVVSLPGLGPALGARALAEFGDDPARYSDAKARKAYAGTAPIRRASGTRHTVLARVARNRHLVNACFRWAYASWRGSPGARSYYDAHRARGQTHNQALRGSVESANKRVVEVRLKGSGMHWAREHVNPLVALRTIACADRWAEAWPQIEQHLRDQMRQLRAQRQRGHRMAHPPSCPTHVPAPGARNPSKSPSLATQAQPPRIVNGRRLRIILGRSAHC